MRSFVITINYDGGDGGCPVLPRGLRISTNHDGLKKVKTVRLSIFYHETTKLNVTITLL